jgi:predicted NACHT family NTPase
VIFDEESSTGTDLSDTEAIDIQTALLRYPKLAIVGDPGSGKSTFLKYVALMLARSVLEGNAAIAIDKLCIREPLPIPVFVSCWDLSDFCRRRRDVEISGMLDFLTERLNKFHFYLTVDDLASLLKTGNCALLFDGLDEVPTDSGRALISRLLEDLVKNSQTTVTL